MGEIVHEPQIMTVLLDTEGFIILGRPDGTYYNVQKFKPLEALPDTLRYSHTQSELNPIGKWPENLPNFEVIDLFEIKPYKIAVGFLKNTGQWVISKLTK